MKRRRCKHWQRNDNTESYLRRITIGRWKLGIEIYIHHYGLGYGKRYVVKPHLIVDTK